MYAVVYTVIYIQSYIQLYSVIPRHIFLSFNQNRSSNISRTGCCQRTLEQAGKCILSQPIYSIF